MTEVLDWAPGKGGAGGAGGMGGAGGIAELDDDDRKLGFLLKAGVDGLWLAENMVAREVVKLAGEEVVIGGGGGGGGGESAEECPMLLPPCCNYK